MFRFLFLQFLLALPFFSEVQAETLYYQIRYRDHKIGQLRIERRQQGSATEIRFRSRVDMQLLFRVKVFDSMWVSFRNGQLEQAYLYRTQNGKVKVNNRIRREGALYRQWSEGEETASLSQPILFSTANLYFHEPAGLSRIYSEKFQQFISIRPQGGHRYRLMLPDGNYTEYEYRQGLCHFVEAHTDWARIQFVMMGQLPDV